jgi:hypothetical protein
MNPSLPDLLHQLATALQRIERKAQPLLENPALLDQEAGQDLLDVICMQFLAVGEAIKRLDRLTDGALTSQFPEVDWRGAMGFRDVIALQVFDLDAEQILVICEQSLPLLHRAVRQLQENP